MILNNINKKTFLITPLSLIQSIGLLLLATLLEIAIAIVPSSFAKIYLSTDLLIWLNFFIGIFSKVIVVICLTSWFCSNEKKLEKIHYKPGRIFCLILILFIAYRIFYNNTFIYVFNFTNSNSVINNTFRTLFQYKFLALGTVLLVNPIYEEILFRSFLLEGLRQKYSDLFAILLSALLFGLVHMNLIQGINTFIIGIILGFVYTRTESLYQCIFAHIAHNMFALLLSSKIHTLTPLRISLNFIISIVCIYIIYRIVIYINTNRTII